MRWQKKTLRAVNRTRGTVIGLLELRAGTVESSGTVVGDTLEFSRVDRSAEASELSRLRQPVDNRYDVHREEGQSLLETAVTMPLLLALAFNLINVGYFWVVVLSLSAAAHQGVQFASQGGSAASTISAPTTAAVSDLVYENVTHTINGATNSNVAVRVCSSAKGVDSTTGVTLCDQFGPAFTFPAPTADPESPAYVLNRVDVGYTVTPIIPGTVFGVLLPSNLQFQRHASMRSLY